MLQGPMHAPRDETIAGPPALLTATDGTAIATPAAWVAVRRLEPLDLFERHVVGTESVLPMSDR